MLKNSATMRTSKILVFASLVTPLILASLPAFAQESRIATQAVRCSAVFFVLADAHAKDEKLAPQFHHSAAMFSALYVKELNEKTANANAEDGLRRRDQVLQEFRQTFRDRQDPILEEAVLCGSWAEGFNVQGETYEYVPIIPKIIPQKIREIYAGYAATAFQRWIK